MKVFIYELVDPLDIDNPRYVGKTNNPSKRLKEHLHDKSKTYKGNWIRSLIKDGRNPLIQIIDEVEESQWKFWEKY